MPSAITTPSSTVRLSVEPIISTPMKVPASENGTPSPTSSASREPRNIQHISSTANRPNSAFDSITPIALRVAWV